MRFIAAFVLASIMLLPVTLSALQETNPYSGNRLRVYKVLCSGKNTEVVLRRDKNDRYSRGDAFQLYLPRIVIAPESGQTKIAAIEKAGILIIEVEEPGFFRGRVENFRGEPVRLEQDGYAVPLSNESIRFGFGARNLPENTYGAGFFMGFRTFSVDIDYYFYYLFNASLPLWMDFVLKYSFYGSVFSDFYLGAGISGGFGGVSTAFEKINPYGRDENKNSLAFTGDLFMELNFHGFFLQGGITYSKISLTNSAGFKTAVFLPFIRFGYGF